MALDSFGSRIPQLSFEVIADDDVLSVGDIFDALGEGRWSTACDAHVTGLAADGPSLRGLIEPLADVLGLSVFDDGSRLSFASEGAYFTPDGDAFGARAGTRGGPVSDRQSTSRARLPGAVRLGYADPTRDYQPGAQVADLAKAALTDPLDLPVALDPGTARQWAWRSLMATRTAGELAAAIRDLEGRIATASATPRRRRWGTVATKGL